MSAVLKGPVECSGCSLCLLPCPVWHASRDVRLSPQGRAKALQHGVRAMDLKQSIDSCTLCGACEPACPENIGLMDMIMELRARLTRELATLPVDVLQPDSLESAQRGEQGRAVALQVIPDRALVNQGRLLEQVLGLWPSGKAAIAADTGADLALALESGREISARRLEKFLAPLRQARQLVVGDGLLFRALRRWLPDKQTNSLGATLSGFKSVSKRLRPGDFYVIESRAYHADRERCVKHYDALRKASGCEMNLDLQRLAVSTTAASLATASGLSGVDAYEQARWMLKGREALRIIVEDLSDIAVFSRVTIAPVMHVAQLIENSTGRAACAQRMS